MFEGRRTDNGTCCRKCGFDCTYFGCNFVYGVPCLYSSSRHAASNLHPPFTWVRYMMEPGADQRQTGLFGTVWIRAASRKPLSSVVYVVMCLCSSTNIASSPHIRIGHFYQYQGGRKSMFFFSSVVFTCMPFPRCGSSMPTFPCTIGSFPAHYQCPCIIEGIRLKNNSQNFPKLRKDTC